MLSWILQISIASICFIFLIHHLIYFLKNTLTIPKTKDLVTCSSEKYNKMYSILENKSNDDNLSNTNIYDTNKNLTHEERGICYGKNNQFMGGKIVLRHKNDMEEKIVFRMKDAEIYENPESMSYFTYDQSSNMHFIYTLF